MTLPWFTLQDFFSEWQGNSYQPKPKFEAKILNCSFAVAHLFYILSLPSTSLLGRRPAFGFFSAATLLSLAAAIWHFFLRCSLSFCCWNNCLPKTIFRAGLTDPVLAVGVPVYILWLTSTVWRAAVSHQWLMFLGAAIFMVRDKNTVYFCNA